MILYTNIHHYLILNHGDFSLKTGTKTIQSYPTIPVHNPAVASEVWHPQIIGLDRFTDWVEWPTPSGNDHHFATENGPLK